MEIYPKHLLPYSNYHCIEQNDLISQPGLVLIRHIESDKVKWIENSNIIHPDCIQIQSDHLRDLSNNLLGIFRKDDIFYGINKEHKSPYCDLWEENTNGLMPKQDEYFCDKNRGFYFISIDDLKNFNIPEIGDQKYHFMVFHTPTKCNFWHISIRILNKDNQEVSSLELTKNNKRKIWKTAKDFLITDIISSEIKSSPSRISKEYYLKSS